MSEASGVLAVPRDVAVPRPAARVDALYRRYHEFVYRVALRYGRGDAAWAEDVTQEVFVGLFEVIDRLSEAEALEPWFYRVTINRCLNRLRRQRVRGSAPVRWLLGDRQARPVDPERLTAARQGLSKAWGVLDSLPPKERVAFVMYYVDGKRQSEIGEILGHGKSYVCKLIKRAEDRVRAAGWEVGA